MTERVEADAVAELASSAAEPKLVDMGAGAAMLVVPKGATITNVKQYRDEYLPAPVRREGTAKFATLESFIAWTRRNAGTSVADDGIVLHSGSTEPMQGDAAVVFADVLTAQPKLVSVIDYHEPGPGGAPKFGRHRGLYAFPLSDEWSAWRSTEKQALTQQAFAEFLENRIVDVVDPGQVTPGAAATKMLGALGVDLAGPSRLLELARGLTVRVNSRVGKAVNLSSGETQITYDTAHQDESGAPLKVPSLFLIGIPIFRGGAAYQLTVRLRYRVKDQAISWFYEIAQADRALADAVTEAAERAAKETGLPLFYGTPEQG